MNQDLETLMALSLEAWGPAERCDVCHELRWQDEYPPDTPQSAESRTCLNCTPGREAINSWAANWLESPTLGTEEKILLRVMARHATVDPETGAAIVEMSDAVVFETARATAIDRLAQLQNWADVFTMRSELATRAAEHDTAQSPSRFPHAE